ncbi:serine/threonine-protein phosphatase PGAM5, mitochondrial-like isoform X3 [Dermacentor albipictus]|uniref:serine/threonine-protein phosphatase PGAM5, mitochondrial-like isoform X3 n=1 Tax=Dermacentor albipictus TaxID=60249 RepID=UPI0038FC331D
MHSGPAVTPPAPVVEAAGTAPSSSKALLTPVPRQGPKIKRTPRPEARVSAPNSLSSSASERAMEVDTKTPVSLTPKNKCSLERGRKQADLTGQRLKHLGVPFSRLVHSSMTRAIETAEIIHKHLEALPMESCELIREGAPVPPEPPFGTWKPEAKVFFTDGARIEAGFRKYFYRAAPSQREDSHEIIVCHANVIRYWICRALQFPPEAWSRISLANCSISVVRIPPSGRVSVRSLGDTGHFPREMITTS